MAKQRSIRFRLTAWYALTLAGALALFALAVGLSMRRSLIHDVDSALRNRLASVESFLSAELKEPNVQIDEELGEYARAFPPNSLLRVQDEHAAVMFVSTPAFPWPTADSLGGRLTWQGHDYRFLAQPIAANGRRWMVCVAEPLDSVEHLQARLWFLLGALIPVVIAIATLCGSWLSRRALKPVDEITAAARTIGIENLSQRLTVPQSGDELQRLSETWNTMLARLEEAVKRLRTFTADASHELRTPLTVIRTTAEIASRKTRPAESYRESLTQIVAESERMTQLVEDLLFMARCDAGTLDEPLARIDLGMVVTEVCQLLAPLASAKSLALNIEQPPQPLRMVANESAIHRLVLILVDNAIKFSPENAAVTIKLWEADQTVKLAVADAGPGISAADRPRIFDRFYKSPETTRNGHGAGLGLALAAGIADHHGASIAVTSKEGEGSTFTVSFPGVP